MPTKQQTWKIISSNISCDVLIWSNNSFVTTLLWHVSVVHSFIATIRSSSTHCMSLLQGSLFHRPFLVQYGQWSVCIFMNCKRASRYLLPAFNLVGLNVPCSIFTHYIWTLYILNPRCSHQWAIVQAISLLPNYIMVNDVLHFKHLYAKLFSAGCK